MPDLAIIRVAQVLGPVHRPSLAATKLCQTVQTALEHLTSYGSHTLFQGILGIPDTRMPYSGTSKMCTVSVY
jgi:hypothetical protein